MLKYELFDNFPTDISIEKIFFDIFVFMILTFVGIDIQIQIRTKI